MAIAWPIVQFGFEQYSLHVDFTHVYGALSAPLVLLLWFYCMASIFLFGAQFSVAWLWGSNEKPEPIPDVPSPTNSLAARLAAASRVTLVFVHGAGCTSEVFAAQMAAFENAVALDLPGHGVPGSAGSIGEFADAVSLALRERDIATRSSAAVRWAARLP